MSKKTSTPEGGELAEPVDERYVVIIEGGVVAELVDEAADLGWLDTGRHPSHHLSFSRGIHFCLGAPLARLGGRIAIGTVVRRLPGLHPDGEARRRSYVNLRGFVTMPLAA